MTALQPRTAGCTTRPAAPVVLVDPLRTGRPFKQACHERGIPVVSVYTLPARLLAEMDPDHRAGDTFSLHGDDVDALALALAGGAGAVVGTTEPSVVTADHLAERLGLPGNPTSTSAARRDKTAMRRHALAVGITVPRHEVVTDPEQFPAAAARIGYPVVLKHPTGAGAHGVHLVTDDATGIRTCSGGAADLFGHVVRSWLVEEYVPGREIAVNTFTWDGATTVVDAWEYRRPTTEAYDQPYWDVVRIDGSDPDWTAVTAFALDVCDAFGMRVGPAHVEVKTGRGHPVLIEVASRLPGLHMTDHWARHSAASPYSDVLASHLGEHPGVLADPGPLAYDSATAVCCITHDGPPGRLRAVHGLAEAARLPGVDEVLPQVSPGAHIATTTGLDTVAVLVLVSGPDPEAVDKTIRSVRDTIRLDVS